MKQISPRWFVALVGFALSCCGPDGANAQNAAPPAAPSRNAAHAERLAEVRRLIAELDGPSFQQREVATRRLLELGEIAAEPLDEATLSKSAEVRTRATAILRVLRVRPLRTAFAELARQPDEKLNLEQGMWLIARIVDPKVRREDLTRQLDEIAARVRVRLGPDLNPRTGDPQKVVETLRLVLFEEYKFTGNADDYNNPNNSSLAKVLETRKGLPILLSHVVVAVAERLGVPIIGLPTPGRYIVKYDASKAPAGFKLDDIYIDPFADGKILSKDELLKMFPGGDPASIIPGTRRSVLIRMMNNLETHLFGRGQTEKAQQVVEYKLILSTTSDDEM